MKNLFCISTVKLTIAFLICSLIQTSADAAGVVDRSFGTNGTVTTDVPVGAFGIDALFLPDGKFIVVGGSSYDSNILLVRYNENGSLDSSFGDNGKVVFNVAARVFAAALQSDGKIVVVGTSPSLDGSSPRDFFVVRFDAQGTVDAGFGSGGIVRINQGSYDNFNALAIQSDGKIVAAGTTSDGGNRGVIFRFNPNGSIDNSFADGGAFFYSFPNTNTTFYQGFLDIEVLPDGRILTGATFYQTQPNALFRFNGYLLVMLNSGGGINTSFGSQGAVSDGTYDNFYSQNLGFEILPGGKIFTAHISGIRIYNAVGGLDRKLPFEGTKATVFPNGRILVSESDISGVGNLKLYTSENIVGKAFDVPPGAAFVHPNGKIIIVQTFGGNFLVHRLSLITSQGTRLAAFDGDDKTDFGVYRPGTQVFSGLKSSGGSFALSVGATTKIIPELNRYVDITFNGQLIRRDSFINWKQGIPTVNPPIYAILSETGTNIFARAWGLANDIPVGGDYNGDALTDLTVFRPSDGVWYSIRGENNSFGAVQWGTTGDKPVPADYDYDGKTDYAVYRPSTGVWWIRRSSDGSSFGVQFGAAADIPLTGDFDGDGLADFVVFRPSNGVWYQLLTTSGFRAIQFGFGTDVPVPGDYDGDGRHDIAVFRQGVWYLLQSTEGFKAVQWGTNGDVPVSVRYDE